MGRIISKVRKEDNRIILDVIIYNTEEIKQGNVIINNNTPYIKCKALVDTGAPTSFISKKIIDKLKLKSFGKFYGYNLHNGKQILRYYKIILGIYTKNNIRKTFEMKIGSNSKKPNYVENVFLLPTIVIGKNEEEIFAVSGEGYDMLLGMSEIMEGNLIISGNNFIFSI